MHLSQQSDVINACRFCFMCRHLSAVGNVTFRESDTPRGRALAAEILMRGSAANDPDYADVFYRADLSGANRFHCINHYDEVGLILAARRDLVEADRAPEAVRKLAAELQQANFRVSGSGDRLYYVDPHSPIELAPPDCKIISGGDPGKALEVLGYVSESDAVFARFREAVKASGCRTLITSCPASYDLMRARISDEIRVLHSSETIEGVPGTGTVFFLDSDYLKNYRDNMSAPRDLLTSLGYTLLPFGTNGEESYSAGEGAVVYDRLYPGLVARMCARIASLADHPESDILVTVSPYTHTVLRRYAPTLNVMRLDTLATRGR